METKNASMRGIAALFDKLDTYDVPRHPDIDKALSASAFVQNAITGRREPSGRLLDLDETKLDRHLTESAARMDPRPIGAAGTVMQRRLLQEAVEILTTDHLPVILDGLRGPFNNAAKGVNTVAKAGVLPGMKADDVIDLVDLDAVKAWKALPEYTAQLDSIAAIRVDLSETFGIPPSITHPQAAIGETVDYTACFTHPDTGVTTGWGTRGTVHRWLSLSIATNGRLRLNDPAETEAVLHGEGESPGYIVAGAAAIVRDDDRRDLHLYRHDWIPSWVDVDQIDRLIELGLIVAARPEAVRPPDQHPVK